jgi:hypothetical protein
MNSTAALAVIAGLALRLMIPVVITAAVVMALTWLDRRWLREGKVAHVQVEKPECWKAQGCSPADRRQCAGYKSSMPCWQVFRHRNGYLATKCLGCPVLMHAPVPVHT